MKKKTLSKLKIIVFATLDDWKENILCFIVFMAIYIWRFLKIKKKT